MEMGTYCKWSIIALFSIILSSSTHVSAFASEVKREAESSLKNFQNLEIAERPLKGIFHIPESQRIVKTNKAWNQRALENSNRPGASLQRSQEVEKSTRQSSQLPKQSVIQKEMSVDPFGKAGVGSTPSEQMIDKRASTQRITGPNNDEAKPGFPPKLEVSSRRLNTSNEGWSLSVQGSAKVAEVAASPELQGKEVAGLFDQQKKGGTGLFSKPSGGGAEAVSDIDKDSGQTEYISQLLSFETPNEILDEGPTTELSDSVNLAITTNPKVHLAYAQAAAAQSDIQVYVGQLLPRVDLDVSGGWQKYDSDTTRTQEGGVENNNRYRTYGLTITQPIFDGFSTAAKIDQTENRNLAAVFRARELMNNIASDAIATHLDVIKYKVTALAIEAQRAFHLRILGAMQARQSGGVGSAGDVTAIEARLARLESSLARNLTDELNASAAYERLVGIPPKNLVIPIAPNDLPVSFEKALVVAQRKNMGLRALGAEVAAASNLRDVRDSQLFPQLSFEAGATRNEYVNGDRSTTNDYKALLRLRWNLFAGGADIAASSEASARIREASARRDIAHIEIREQIVKLYQQIDQLKFRKQKMSEAAISNQRTLEANIAQFEIGQKTLLEVLDSANESYVTEIELIDLIIQQLYSSYRVIALTGQLDESLGMRPLELDHKDYNRAIGNLEKFPTYYRPEIDASHTQK